MIKIVNITHFFCLFCKKNQPVSVNNNATHSQMLKKINELNALLNGKAKKLVLAVAHDHHALDAVYNAFKKNIINPILVGDKSEIEAISAKYGYDFLDVEIIDEANKNKAIEISVKLVRDNKADILMKGNVGTGPLLKGVLNGVWGLRKGKTLSHFTLLEIPGYHKLMGLTDVAMNIAPTLKEKQQILANAVGFMHGLGFDKPKVAALAAVETVNEAMPATIDAAILSKMSQRGQLGNCIVDGPLAYDNIVNPKSAKHKGIVSEVAGDADLMLVPTIETGNVLYKALAFSGANLAAVILGAKAPIVLTSRADSEEVKLNSILLAAASK